MRQNSAGDPVLGWGRMMVPLVDPQLSGGHKAGVESPWGAEWEARERAKCMLGAGPVAGHGLV